MEDGGASRITADQCIFTVPCPVPGSGQLLPPDTQPFTFFVRPFFLQVDLARKRK